jgi:lysophospholipase L1-like esterase
MWGLALVLAGILITGAGVRVALERGRPLNLAGMLLAPLGLCLALMGVGRVLSPSFFGRDRAAPRALRIMPAGDWLTCGWSGGGRDQGGYRGPLWVRLQARGRGVVDLVGATRGGPFAIDRDHEAFPDITVDGLAERLHADLPVHAPDVVLLQVGTNDLVAGGAPEVIVGQLGALIDAVLVRSPQAQLLVGSLVGVRPGGPSPIDRQRFTAVNAGLRAAVQDRAARGEPIRFVDLRAWVGRAAADFRPDGLHLSERGYEQLAQAWFEALGPLLDRPGATAAPGRSR